MAHETRIPALNLRLICQEPFRLFFPLGIMCGLIGVSHWLFYQIGWTERYSCFYHGLVQIQGFQICFIVGFLMTALPKFMDVPGARPFEILISTCLVLACMAGLIVENWFAAEVGFLALIVHTIVFAARRFRRRRDSPPPEFVFIVIGLLHALVGGALLLQAKTTATGRPMVEQGMTLSFMMAIGGYLLPRLLGYRARSSEAGPQVSTESASGRSERVRIALYLAAGCILFLSFLGESFVSERAGRLVRAGVVSAYFIAVVGVYRRPRAKVWHVRFLHLSLLFAMAGLWLSGLFPEYGVVALHMLFVGGFSLITLAVAVRAVASHCGFESLWDRNPAPVVLFGTLFLIALGLRICADLFPEAYFPLLATAAGVWSAGVLVWGVYFVPKLRFQDVSE